MSPKLIDYSPYIGYETTLVFGPDPTVRKKNPKPSVLKSTHGSPCREEIVYRTQEELADLCMRETEPDPPKKATRKVRRRAVPIWRQAMPELQYAVPVLFEDRRMHEPGATYLFVNHPHDDPYDFYEGGTKNICPNPCCIESLIEAVDALVGPVCVLLDDDRYTGNWWMTDTSEAVKPIPGTGMNQFRWYGTDNFFLRHPALTSLIFGLFRQAVVFHFNGRDGDIRERVSRQEVEKCLSEADTDLAQRLVRRLRPVIELKDQRLTFPVKPGWLDFVLQLHRAIDKHGYEDTFGGDFASGWGLSVIGAGLSRGANGFRTFFGTSKTTSNSRRVTKLARA